MADFCKQCSEDIFGEDFGELAGLIKEEQVTQGFYAVAICEGCGYTLVDHTGKCVAIDCIKKHGAHDNEQ